MLIAVSSIDRRWAYYNFINVRLRSILWWSTTRNVDELESIECELVGVNLRDSLIFIILSDELKMGYTGLLILSTLLLIKMTELKRIEQLQMFLQLRTAIERAGDEHACNGPGVLQISFDWRGSIHALKVHTNIFLSSSSGLIVLEKDAALLFRFLGFLCK